MSSPLDLLAAATAQPDSALVESIAAGTAVAASLTQSVPSTVYNPVSTDFFNASTLSSLSWNTFFTQVSTDLVRLFAAANDNNNRVGAVEQLGLSNLTQVTAQVDRLEKQIQATSDLQLGYNAGYTVYNRVDFIDNSAIELDPIIVGGLPLATYDPELQGLTLGLQSKVDTLHSSSGTVLVDVNLDLQLGLPDATFAQLRTPIHAVDGNGTSYWGDVVLSDQPVQLPWPPINSVYQGAVALGALESLSEGAVCEYTINYNQPTPWNSLTIQPFCEQAINLAAVFVVKRDPGFNELGETRFLQGGAFVGGDGTLQAKYWNGSAALWYPTYGGEFDVTPNVTNTPSTINFGATAAALGGASSYFPAGVNTSYFYGRYEGWIFAQNAGTYTIGVNSSNGVNLYVNGIEILAHLATAQSATTYGVYTNSGTITLAENTWYPITIEYQESTNNAVLQLLWTPPGASAAVVVPSANLSSATPQPLTTTLPVDPTIPAGYVRSYITEFASQRDDQGRLWLNQTQRLYFPLQEDCLWITLVFHQPHYTREVFSLPMGVAYANSLWQQMLGNTPLLGVPQALISSNSSPQLDLSFTQPEDLIQTLGQAVSSNLSGSFTTPNTQSHTYTKYQYTYGAYDIEVYNQSYVTQSQFISVAQKSPYNLVQGAILPDYDIPLTSTSIAASGAWFGNAAIPLSWEAPAATLTFDLTFGQSQPWYPLAPLDATLVHEPLEIESDTSLLTLRLQATPGTPVYVTSFDGLGNATLIGGVLVQGVSGTSVGPTQINLVPFSAELAGPGFYVLSYTPIDTSQYVNFLDLAEASNSATQETFVFSGSEIDVLRGLKLTSEPYIDSDQISINFEPNGNPLSEYVPIQVSITNMPITFPNIVNSSGISASISSFAQDISHQQDIYTSVQVTDGAGHNYELLTSTDPDPRASSNFSAAHGNWDTRHVPSLFAIDKDPQAPPLPIPQFDANGNSIWIYNPGPGTVTFVNENTGVVGAIVLNYWYYTSNFNAPPVIVDATDYTGRGDAALTPFNATLYPVIEYILVNQQLYFNVEIPDTATVTVTYMRLFDTTRVRATFTRVDPVNQSATPHLYGYTFLARDGNVTSYESQEFPEVAWGDLELYSLGSTTQTNPGIGFITGNVSPATGGPNYLPLPTFTQFNWWRIINSGSVPDLLRANYDPSNGTTVYWDFDSSCYIPSSGGLLRGVDYEILNADGSNTIPINPGQAIVVGIANPLVLAPNGPGTINPATIFSGFTTDFLQSTDWLLEAESATAITSIAAVTIF